MDPLQPPSDDVTPTTLVWNFASFKVEVWSIWLLAINHRKT